MDHHQMGMVTVTTMEAIMGTITITIITTIITITTREMREKKP